jgi:hypothetical protein
MLEIATRRRSCLALPVLDILAGPTLPRNLNGGPVEDLQQLRNSARASSRYPSPDPT